MKKDFFISSPDVKKLYNILASYYNGYSLYESEIEYLSRFGIYLG